MAQPQNRNDITSPKIICFFSHKGGVSKTTNVYHLAWMLADKFNKNVLMVDADPQCSLTHALIKNSNLELDWTNGHSRGNIFHAVKPAFDQNSARNESFHAECTKISLHKNDINDPKFSVRGNLYLIPGSLKLSSLETQIALAQNLSGSEAFPILKNICGAFKRLFVNTAAVYGAEYVLVDMAPSVGELNKNLFLASDYFFVPVTANVYCRSTILYLKEILPNWKRTHDKLVQTTRDHEIPLEEGMPRFLGAIVSMFRVAGKRRKPIKQCALWMDFIKETLSEELLPLLSDQGMLEDGFDPNTAVMAEVPSFLQLAQIVQMAKRPVFALAEEDMRVMDEEGDLVEMDLSEKKRNLERAKYFLKVYEDFADSFLKMVGNSKL